MRRGLTLVELPRRHGIIAVADRHSLLMFTRARKSSSKLGCDFQPAAMGHRDSKCTPRKITAISRAAGRRSADRQMIGRRTGQGFAAVAEPGDGIPTCVRPAHSGPRMGGECLGLTRSSDHPASPYGPTP